MSIIIGIDHGYYAIKTAHCSFPAGLTSYGEHEPYTRQGLLEFGGCFFVCGSGRQPIQRDKTINDNYYLLTLAAIAKEIQQRGLPPECSVRIAAGLPLTSFGRDKPKFRDYLLRSNQPLNYNWRSTCWCWWEQLRAVTALLRKLWDCKAKATHHYGAPQILCLMIENPFQQIRCLCTTACNLQNNVNQFFLRVVKFNSVNCQKNQHNVGADALVAIHKWVIAD